MAKTAKLGLVAVGPPTPDNPSGSGSSFSFYTPDFSVSNIVLLLRRIRTVIIDTLPEIKMIPENIFTQLSIKDNGLQTPFLVLLPKAPRPGSSAVNDNLQILTIEFVYVIEDVNSFSPDAQEYVRNRLTDLKRALLTDYRQGGLANDTRLVQDPLPHMTQYNSEFAKEAQPVTALYMTMEFDVIEQMIQGTV